MTAEPRTIRTEAEKTILDTFDRVGGGLPGGKLVTRAARGGVRSVPQDGTAPPAHRGMEVHRPPRADAEGDAAGRAAVG